MAARGLNGVSPTKPSALPQINENVTCAPSAGPSAYGIKDTCFLIDDEGGRASPSLRTQNKDLLSPKALVTYYRHRSSTPVEMGQSESSPPEPMASSTSKQLNYGARNASFNQAIENTALDKTLDGSLEFHRNDSRASFANSSVGRITDRSWTPSVAAVSAVRDRIRDHPAWLSIRCFVAAICFLITVHGALSTGYITSVITTIEKRFEIRSQTSGLVVSSYEIGSLLSVLFVSYFGSRGHIPRYVGIGGLFLSCGALLFSLPHFLSAPPFINETVSHDDFAYGMEPGQRCHKGVDTSLLHNVTNCEPESKSSASAYVFILIIAQIIIGMGGTPLFTLGTTYIDNHVDKDSSSVLLAIMYVCTAFGPVCGFLLGSLMLSNYVNPPAPALISDQAWIGLWWGGYIILGALYFLAAVPFFGFPKTLPSYTALEKQRTELNEVEQKQVHVSEFSSETSSTITDYGASLKKIPLSILRLLKNSVYMVASLNACMDVAIVSGFTVFLPKYLETQFGVSKAKASLLTGGVAVPGACVGIFMGGWIMKKCKLQLKGASAMILIFNVIALFLLSMFFFVGCQNINLAGVFTFYKSDLKNPFPHQSVNVTNGCNVQCGCHQKEYKPVCGTDGLTYFSPCFAGCHDFNWTSFKQNTVAGPIDVKKVAYYTNCHCINPKDMPTPAALNASTMSPAGSSTEQPSGDPATPGACETGCGMLAPFLFLLFMLTLAASNNQMPLVMVTLRAVSEDEKAFALGLQVVLLRLLAYIPAPIIFGSTIDTTCLAWSRLSNVCGDVDLEKDGTSCLLYDIETFKVRYGAIALVLKAVGAALSMLLYWCIKRRGKAEEPFSPPITMSEIVHRLGDKEDLHLRGCQNAKLRSWLSDDSIYNRHHKSPHRSPRRHQKTMSC